MTLISIPANPVPEGAVTEMLKTPDGVSIRFARWAPPPGRKGTVCIFQGRTEFIEKYFEMVRDLRARGFAVATIDWRGQGLSERQLADGRKGHITNFAKYEIDLDTFMAEVVLPDCPPPLFALGHSMGAAVLLRAAAHGRRWFDRMVLTAPLIALTHFPLLMMAPKVVRTLRVAGLGSRYVPGRKHFNPDTMPFLKNPVTSDPVRYTRNVSILEAEPKLCTAGPTVAWLDAAFRVMTELSDPRFPAKLRQPMLIVACGHDPITSTPAIEDFGSRLRVGSCVVIPGAKHEIMMEQDAYRTQFWAAFDAFVPGTPPY